MKKRMTGLCATAILFCCLAGVAWGQVSASRSQPMRVAMLSDGNTFMDNSFNQACREGIESLMHAGAPIFVQFCETTSPKNFKHKLAAYAERNYQLLIGVGYRMAEPIETVAEDYPRTLFACVDVNDPNPPHNVWALSFQVDECAFPAGYLAAAWAHLKDPDNPAVAWVGGQDVDSVNQFVVGFRKGAQYFNKLKNQSVRILGGHVGDFDDFEGGKKLAEEFLDDGADVIFGVGSITGNGAIAAAREYGRWAIGVDTDQYYTLPNESDIILTSCLKAHGPRHQPGRDRRAGKPVLGAARCMSATCRTSAWAWRPIMISKTRFPNACKRRWSISSAASWKAS